MQYKYIVLGVITSLVGGYVYEAAFKSKEKKSESEIIFDNENELE